MRFNRKKFFDGIRDFLKSDGKTLTQKRTDALEFLISKFEPTWASIPQIAYALATIYHETAHTFEPITELGPKSYFNKYNAGTRIGRNLGNTQEGDGYRFRGRGYVQITGRSNYQKFGIAHSPDAALNPEVAFNILMEGMSKGLFTGKKLSDYISDTGKDYKNARRIINGLDKAALIAGYANKFEAILRASKTNSAAVPTVDQTPSRAVSKPDDTPTTNVQPPDFTEGERPTSTQIAENIVNTGDKQTPDNFVEENKTVAAPPKEGTTATATKVTIAGIVVPGFVVAIIQSLKDLVSQGYVDAREVGNTVLTFIGHNQKYVFILVGLIILLLILKKAFKQITLWIEMWLAADPNKHNVKVEPQ